MCQRKKYSLSIASHPEPRKTKRRQNLQSLSNAPRNIDGDVTSTTNMAASSPTSKQTLATPLHHFPDARFWPTNSSVDASAFELSRWRGGRYRVVGPSIVARVRFGSQGGHCDPSQKVDAGGTPASQLRAEHGSFLHPCGGGFCEVLPPFAGPTRSKPHPRILGSPVS